MLTIVTGQAKSGKRYQTYGAIVDAIKQNNGMSCMLIVPEQYTLEAEKELIKHGNLNGFLGMEVLSIKRLMYFIFKEVGTPDGIEITELGKLMLLKQIFETNKSALKYYQKAFNRKGLLQKCYEMIDEFKQNRITTDMLSTFKSDDAILNAKIEDLSLIYNAYEAAKKNKLMDQADYYEALLERMPDSKWLREKTIWILGFDSFSIQELAVIEALCHYAKDVTVTLTTLQNIEEEIFKHTQNVLSRFMNFEGIEKKIETLENSWLHDDIAFLGRQLMAYPVKVYDDEPMHIKLFGAKNKATEIEWVIRNMMAHIREDGMTWRDFAIVTNDLSGYRMIIQRLFDQYEIPYFIDEKRNILHHPAIHFIMGTIGVISKGFQFEDVIMLLKTGYWDLTEMDIAYFENYLLEHGIKGNRFFETFTKNIREQYDLDRINQIRERFMIPLEKYKSNQAKSKSVQEHLTALFTFMQEVGLAEQVEKDVEHFTQVQDYENAQLFAQVWHAVLNIFDQLVEMIGDEPMRLSDVWERLSVGFESYEIGILPLSEQHVLIGSLDRSKAHPIKVMFLVGVNDGVLPEGGSDMQLILEHEKQNINQHGVRWLSDQTMFIQKENFNIYQAMTRPGESLYLSFAYADQNGGALRPSYLVGKIRGIFPKLEMKVEHVIDNIGEEMIFSVGGMKHHLASQVRTHLDGEMIDDIWFYAMAWLKSHEPLAADQLLRAATHRRDDVTLDVNKVKALYDFPLKTSVSGLEQYVQCPFKHFVSQGLRPKQPKPYEINYPDVGILFHQSLEQFGKVLHTRNISWDQLDRAKCEALIDEIIELLVSEDIYQSKFQYKALIRKLKRVSKRAIWTLTKQMQKGHFKPSAFELAFTDAPFGVPPIMCYLPSGERMMIRGVVDRIDILEKDGKQYINIIDYKSGSRQFSLEDVYYGLQMQLFVYMAACLNQPSYFNSESLLPGGLYFYKIDDPMIESTSSDSEFVDAAIESLLKLDGMTLDDENVINAMDLELFEMQSSSVIQVKIKNNGEYAKGSRVLNETQFKDMMNHVNAVLTQIGEDIVAGKIPVSPCHIENRLSCEFCDYNGICQFEEKKDYFKIRKFEKIGQEAILESIKSTDKKDGQ